jgi:tRNA threonylcarbamoyl adenosine modification protein (Sua5/YciO/YrdC/YwlC family)|tara:strand:+ start:28838 stop:29455 length:618 start_codon:yes stop_codon:yes gene_type:complete
MFIEINPENPNPRGISKIVECLKDGGVVIYPTDTIYGIGCDIFQPKAVERIAKIKGIDLKKQNFSFICSDLSHLSDYALPIDRSLYKIMRKVLPGPYTFILNANSNIPKLFKIKKKTVGIRVPNHNIPLQLVDQIGNPLLTTSLIENTDNIESNIEPSIIYENYKNKVDIVIDGGLGKLTPSTVLDCTQSEIEIIREGLGDLNVF